MHRTRRDLPAFFIALLAAAVLCLVPEQRSAAKEPSSPARKIVVIAHRGAHLEVPENTLASLEKAIEIGCDYVEIDVRRTKDGALVIMHDAQVNRMTNGKGRIDHLTLAEIRKLDIKSRKGGRPSGQKVPTLDEILEHAKGRMRIYVDHKNAPPAQVLAAIEKYGMLHDVVVYGSVNTLREYKRLAPSVWIMPDHPDTIPLIEALAKSLKPETLDGNIADWNREQVEATHRAGVQVWVDNRSEWDNEAGIKRAVEMGVDAIQTDHPAEVLRILNAMGLRGAGAK
jgi:glycerophosphoryl diester phosphodiesterase